MREVKKELDLARSRRDAIDQELEQTNVEVSESEDLIKSYKVMLQNSKSTVDIRTLIEKELPCREEELEKSKVDVARLSSDQLEVHGSMARLEIKTRTVHGRTSSKEIVCASSERSLRCARIW